MLVEVRSHLDGLSIIVIGDKVWELLIFHRVNVDYSDIVSFWIREFWKGIILPFVHIENPLSLDIFDEFWSRV